MSGGPVPFRLANVGGPPSTRICRIYSTGYHFVLKKIRASRSVSTVPESWIRDVISTIDGETVFVHAGLSAINAAFDGDPYEFLRSVLHEAFDTILVPGFTDYFRHSGTYCKAHSKPNTGTFAKLLLADAEHRTSDPMRSIIVDGPYRFDDCNSSHSYGRNSCFGKLDADNVPILNVGTPWLVCSQLHFLEHQYDVPYMESRPFEGVVLTPGAKAGRKITQHTSVPTELSVWNYRKIEQKLEREGAMRCYQKHGLRVLITRAKDLRSVLGPELERDPYWLVR